MRLSLWQYAFVLTLTVLSAAAFAQFGPPMRRHTVTQARQLSLVPANQQVRQRSDVTIRVQGDVRLIQANGLPQHRTGAFPNRGNPHRVVAQRYEYRIPAKPQRASRVTPLGMHNFGIAVNGVPFDPGAAEWYLGNRGSDWRYEPLAGAVTLGLDANYAHVQPTGAYHYHGLPWGLLKELNVKESAHSPIVGWAADGFPIYALYGYANAEDKNSEIQQLKSSYTLKEGNRPQQRGTPGGRYDGTFVTDYKFVPRSGDLDECNGRFGITPDFPDGTYAYFLTEQWPVIPRAYRGTPSQDFQRRGRPGRRRPPPR